MRGRCPVAASPILGRRAALFQRRGESRPREKHDAGDDQGNERGPKGKPQEVKDLERRLHEAEVRSRQLETKLKRAELVIDLQKKIQIAFGQSQESPEKPEPED